MWVERWAPGTIPPFLPAFAGVIAAAAWGGIGPGLLATTILTVWCSFIPDPAYPGSTTGILLRAAVFFAEGVLVCGLSSRLLRTIRIAARSEEWHRSLVETSAEGIWILNPEGTVTYANPRMAEMLGTEITALVGRNYDEFLFPADHAAEKVRFQSRRSTARQQFDRRLRKADSSEVWVLTCSAVTGPGMGEITGGAASDEAPEVLSPGLLAMMTDITERKRAEQALRRSEARFRSLFDNVLEGVYQSTADGRILAANPMLLKMLGLKSETGMNDVNIAADLYVDPEVRRKLLHRLEREGSFQGVEYDLRRRDRSVLTVQENARVVRDEEGRVLYYEGTLTDVTGHNRIQERLRQAQKMEAIGRLAGGIAHDFNNILTVITGRAQLTVDALEPHHAARYSSEQVLRAAEGAAALTEQLMSFSRRQSHDVTTVDMNQIARHAESDLRDLLGNSIGLRMKLAPGGLPVLADPGHIEQILLNLVLRARAGRRIRELAIITELRIVEVENLELHGGARPGSWAVLRVECIADEGEQDGIPTSLVGAQLGAATTQAIVSQYGGLLLPGEASDPENVAVCLPLAGAMTELTELDSRLDRNETVLLVEDEPLIRELSRDMLERQGFRVLVAASPSEALRISGRSGFDVLVTDVSMPEMSGAQLARQLRAARPALKILYISGYSELPLEAAELESPGASLLQKPFSADSLGRKIRGMLGH